MAISIAKCSYLGHCELNEEVTTPKYGYGFINTGIAGAYYSVGIIKFRTPNVASAISRYLDFKLDLDRRGSVVSLNYALCTSDENYKNYCNTYNTVVDSNQIALGTLNESNVENRPGGAAGFNCLFRIDVETLKPNTVYYLFIWSALPDSIAYTNGIDFDGSNHKIEMAFLQGVVHIDNGSGFEMYQCCIDNGTGWDVCVPHIDNGISWDMYS